MSQLRELKSPVNVTATKLWPSRERRPLVPVALGSPSRANIDGMWLDLHTDIPLVAGASANERAFFVGADGDLYLAQ